MWMKYICVWHVLPSALFPWGRVCAELRAFTSQLDLYQPTPATLLPPFPQWQGQRWKLDDTSFSLVWDLNPGLHVYTANPLTCWVSPATHSSFSLVHPRLVSTPAGISAPWFSCTVLLKTTTTKNNSPGLERWFWGLKTMHWRQSLLG